MSNLVELRGISKNYLMDKVTVKAVENATFTIKKKEFAAISGPSGSGKSTLLNIIGLIDLPTEGSLFLDGRDIYGEEKFSQKEKLSSSLDRKLTELRRKNIGFIFQTFNLIPVLNVKENIALPLSLGPSYATETMSKKERNEWVDFLIEAVGLSGWKNHKPSELSGGQRQRVAIARALSTKAKMILADEPTANLDSKNGEQILSLMKNLNQELETTFIFSTHDPKIVAMADHIIKIADGKIESA